MYTLICTSVLVSNAVGVAATGPFGIASSQRQAAHFRVDRSFNSTGFTTDRFAGGSDTVAGAHLLPDGKAIVGVSSYGAGVRSFEVIRLNVDGSRDRTFGIGCKINSVGFLGWPTDTRQALFAIQADGKIVASTGQNVMRCETDGTLDESFGVGGLVQPNAGGIPAVQSDGKIVLGGFAGTTFRITRLDNDGSPDTSFGTDGIASVELPPNPGLWSVRIQADGKIVAAGSTGGDFALARFNPDGSLDTTFDGDGKATTAILNSTDHPYNTVLQPDGKILAAGFALNSASSTSGVFALARYNTDGSLDTTFDGDGKVTTPVVNAGSIMLDSSIRSIALLADGKILVAGRTHNGKNFDHVLARYNANGSLDPAFGSGGFVVAPIPTFNDQVDDLASVVLIRPDGRILTVGDSVFWLGGGFAPYSGLKDITVRQFNIDGTSDITFVGGGKTDIDVGADRTVGTAVALQPDGKILATASSFTGFFNANQEIRVLARYNPDGSRDTSFNGNGFIRTNVPVTKLTVSSDGKVAAGGSGSVFRYNSDGTLDSSFDGDGQVTGVGSGGGLLFQPDGKLVALSGTVATRLSASGTLDTTFEGDGRATIPFGAASLKLQSDGKILAAGSSNADFAIARLNADGTPDTSFDGDGVATTNIAGPDSLTLIALQPDGKIIASGRSNCCDIQTQRVAFLRYNPDGTLDTAFGTNGKVEFPSSNFPEVSSIYIRTDGKIVALSANATSNRVRRLTAGGQPDPSFYGDGIGTFENARFASNPFPWMSFGEFDAQGRIILIGADRTQPLFNDNRAMFIGRLEISDHPYVHFDFSGDGKADLAVWRPSTRTWHLHTPEAGYTETFYGAAGDRPIPADYDGDGITDLATFTPSTNAWNIFRSESQTQTSQTRNGTALMPIPSDTDGDGYDDLAYFRNGLVNQLASTRVFGESNTLSEINFGVPGDKPVRGDFDGNGRSEVALYRPSNQTWYILSSSFSQGFYTVQWGTAGDIPVPADYDGDGATDIAVWRPSTGQWWILGSNSGPSNWTVWGEPADKPVPADYDGDGKTDIAVWRPSNGNWYIVNSSNSSIRIQQFGQDGDIPLPNAFVY